MTYNYGTFDFETGNFVLKFLHGNLDYTLSMQGFEAVRRAYRAQGRPIIEQTLDLTPAQQRRLVDLLTINMRPENRRYRYHFLFDNCSTRIRDVLEAALGEETLHAAELPDDAQTFRELIEPYQRAVPFLDAGVDVLLGAPVDRPADGREIMFLPEDLMHAFDRARIGAGEDTRPLVVRTDTLLWIEGYDTERTSFPLGGGGSMAAFRRRPGTDASTSRRDTGARCTAFSGDRADGPADRLSLVRFAPRRHQRKPPSLLGMAHACTGGGDTSCTLPRRPAFLRYTSRRLRQR